MIALITRLLLVTQFAIACVLFYIGSQIWPNASGWLLGLASFAIVILFRLGITANNFWLACRFQSVTPPDRQLRRGQAFKLFAEEFFATMNSSSWTMPFLGFHRRPAANPVGLPVLLVHGYGCNSGYWHSMSAALTRANITHHAVDLEPVFADIKDYVPLLRDAVDTQLKETGHDNIVIVAHSMGGLVVRAFLREHGSKGIAKIITLGTPHKGTGLANFGVGANSRQMRWSGNAIDGMPSDWLREMQQTEGKDFYRQFVSIYSHHDNIVSPQTSSYLPGALNIEFHGIGHVALALNQTIQRQVVEEILRASGHLPAASIE